MNEVLLNTKLLKCSQVASILNISPAGVYRLVRDGQLPGIRFNKTVRVKPEELDLFIRQNSDGQRKIIPETSSVDLSNQ